MLLSIFNLRQHFTNFGSKIFNDDLETSHYLYIIMHYRPNCCR